MPIITNKRALFRAILGASAVLAVTAATTVIPTAAQAQTTIRAGVINAISDAAFFIADRKGYFREEGLNVEIVPFKASSQMVAPLGTGELQVAAGAVSAGLYNAIARGIDIRIVADKGSMPKLHGYVELLVRKDLVDSGRYKGFKDLKGMKVGSQSKGGSATIILEHALKKAGLTFNDVDLVYMGHPELAAALQNKAIDAAFVTEPHAARTIRSGAALLMARGDEVYPDAQVAVVLYAGKFITENRGAAERFMRAYVRAARDYNDAIKDGRFFGPKGDEIIKILAEATPVKDIELYKIITPNGCNPNGQVNRESLASDLASFKADGLIKGEPDLKTIIDMSFAEKAVKELGPYKPNS
ncbi:MAG: ABC transporter, substrate-binding protein (cluster 10, nitrate/sulfonate/bicarbonate) [Pseudolabrys sp.]|jgi:NitT/TauT family transport system substrate-binding protein|nr:ABC transporter, substrate-binding protein (cluster 10, nitrate/sulfonate/bicarbonate) [Pseudolabrys sp.]